VIFGKRERQLREKYLIAKRELGQVRLDQEVHRQALLDALDVGAASDWDSIVIAVRRQRRQHLEKETAVRDLAQAIRLTREYVGPDKLPALEGWSWFDALKRHAPEFLADPPTAAPDPAQQEQP
jgi:hypothetical protein